MSAFHIYTNALKIACAKIISAPTFVNANEGSVEMVISVKTLMNAVMDPTNAPCMQSVLILKVLMPVHAKLDILEMGSNVVSYQK